MLSNLNYSPSRKDGHLTNLELRKIERRMEEIDALFEDENLTDEWIIDGLEIELAMLIEILEKSCVVAKRKESKQRRKEIGLKVVR